MPTFEPIASWLHAGIAAVLVAVPMVRPLPRPSPVGLTISPQPADSPAARLSVAEVKARLAAATQSAPPDFSKSDLSGLDLTGLDFKRANLAGASLANSNSHDACRRADHPIEAARRITSRSYQPI